MFPPYYLPEFCPSPAEKEIFKRLRDDPDTKEWIVLHSLAIADHVNQIEGEVDFVIIVPGKGVLCLEAKGHKAIKRDPDTHLWYLGEGAKGELRGPFKQASDGMWSLINRLPGGLSSIFFYSAVAMPYVSFNVSSNEWHDWQCIDRVKFPRPISQIIEEVLQSARIHVSNKPAGFRPTAGEPTPEQCERLLNHLRPGFELFQPRQDLASEVKSELIRFTEEQFQRLDDMSANQRVMFSGPAGTGKTLLALEAVKRAESDGRRVRMICFNNLLGNWLRGQVSGLGMHSRAGSLSQFLVEIVRPSKEALDNADNKFWQEDLPMQAIEALYEDPDIDFTLDEIIVDEAQDLLKPAYLEFLDHVLEGGLAAGKWRMFGDFSNQVIQGDGNVGLEDFMANRSGNATLAYMKTNCRNTPRIVNTIQFYLGDHDYSGIMRPDNDLDCRLVFYSDKKDQELKLADILENSMKRFRGSDMIILSAMADENSVSSGMSFGPWPQRLVPFREDAPEADGHIGYVSIQAFKGLEKPSVVLTDINQLDSEHARSLLYVGMTRGTAQVTALVSEDARETLLRELQAE